MEYYPYQKNTLIQLNMNEILYKAIEDYTRALKWCEKAISDTEARFLLSHNYTAYGLCYYFHQNNIPLRKVEDLGIDVGNYMWKPPSMCDIVQEIITCLELRRNFLIEKWNGLDGDVDSVMSLTLSEKEVKDLRQVIKNHRASMTKLERLSVRIKIRRKARQYRREDFINKIKHALFNLSKLPGHIFSRKR